MHETRKAPCVGRNHTARASYDDKKRRLNITNMQTPETDEEDENADQPSADYPLGGLVEPYDIEREKELTQ